MTNHVIIGTAGHVDHGKTSLINALTQIDTDRLSEEKDRGITIELGFAYLDLPDGTKAGIIDVPGHEKFISNMLAGAGGIDLALLVVAADEGVMPQTLEHLGILELLGIKKGIIALNKIDLVDEDFKMLVEEDIREQTEGTFLEEAPIYPVSAVSGEGVAELRQALIEAVSNVESKENKENMRLPIDRVFTLSGIGTVVTGTLIEGQVKPGDDLELYPQEEIVRIRSVQVHDEDVEKAEAGQRVALNLSSVKKDQVDRGNILASPESLRPSYIFDVNLYALKHAHFPIEDGMRVHVYIGADEILARLALLDRKVLEKGDTCPAQLRLEEKAYAKYGDRFVIRFYSPLDTIGGGVIVDPLAAKRKHKSNLDEFALMAGSEPAPRLELALKHDGLRFNNLDEIFYRAGCNEQVGQNILDDLVQNNKAVQINRDLALHISALEILAEKAKEILSDFHNKYPLESGMKREALRTRLLPRSDIQVSDRVIEALVEYQYLEKRNDNIALPHHSSELSDRQKQLIAELSNKYQESGYAPPNTDDVIKNYPKADKIEQILSRMVNDGILIRLNEQILMHSSFVEKAKEKAINDIKERGSLSLADFRDDLDTTRKYAIAILEYFDRIKLTRLEGDSRILLRL